MLHQNLASGSSLQIWCSVKPETLSVNFLYSSVKIHWPIWHFAWMFLTMCDCVTACTGHSENTGLLSYASLPNVDTLSYLMAKHCILKLPQTSS